MLTHVLATAALAASLTLRQGPPAPRHVCASYGHAMFGSVVCATGDADADGVPDLVVADPCYDHDEDTAYAWLLSGRDFRVLFSRQLEKHHEGSRLLVLGVCDVDGDGVADWLCSGAWFAGNDDGTPAVVSGSTGMRVRAASPRDAAALTPIPPVVDRSGRMHQPPFFPPEGAASPRGGARPLPVGDLDGDGRIDFASAADTETSTPRVCVLSGRRGEVLRTIRHGRPWEYQGFGRSLVSLGDVDDDGSEDIAVGAPDAGVAEGQVLVFSLRTAKLLYELPEDQAGWHWGYDLAALGDVNRDGVSDLAVATWHALSHAPGRARVVSGMDGHLIATFVREGNAVRVLEAELRNPEPGSAGAGK